ncbi:MAG: hypothetical protein HY400_01730, partial [Elusimicrobia bacterium]|nr:hypothetical protein [Elusimicrobiota bacterium]
VSYAAQDTFFSSGAFYGLNSTTTARIAVEQVASDGTRTYVVVGNRNRNLLPAGYRIFAHANPWRPGAFGEATQDCSAAGPCQIAFDQSDRVTISGLAPADYDAVFGGNNFDFRAAGKGSLNLVPVTQSQISIAAGQTVDIGTVNLKPGVSLSGTVKDVLGNALSNIPVTAYPTTLGFDFNQTLTAFSNENGQFTLNGLSSDLRYYDVVAAPRFDSEDAFRNEKLVPYAQSRKDAVDLVATASLNFTLLAANSSLAGRVVTPDGSIPSLPFGREAEERPGEQVPGAIVLVQRVGEIPKKNPIGDIEFKTDASGNFRILNLSTGSYRITALAKGFGSAQTISKIAQQNTEVNVSSMTLARGASLAGGITLSNGDYPNESDIQTVAATTPDFTEILVGFLTKDPNSKQITGYSLSGFKAGLGYQVVLIGDGDQLTVPTEASNVVFSTTTESRTLDLVFKPNTPTVFSKIRKSGGNFEIHFECTQPLRNKTDADKNTGAMASLVQGGGTLAGHTLSPDRKRLTVVYAPVAADTSFKVRFGPAYSSVVDPDSSDIDNPEFVISSTFTFFAGVDAFNQSTINGLLGGSVSLEGDTSRIEIPAGALQVSASSSVAVGMQKADSNTQSGTQALAGGPRLFAYAPQAYPSGLYRAMAALPPTVQPFSAFYDVLLPLGLRTSLSKTAKLTIHYSTATTTDPTTLNIYWYNQASNSYVLQQNLCGTTPEIDYANQTITICVNHFSVFIALGANVSVITGDSFNKTELEVFSFPNPFDLNTKTLTLIHNAAGPSQSVRGTMIHVGLPSSVTSEDVTVDIYNVAGEKVRTLDMGRLTGGAYYYAEWDGRNNSGKDAASGVYIGLVKVGSSKKSFKMALIR